MHQVLEESPPSPTTTTYTGTSTAELKQRAIEGARRRGWMVLEAGDNYTSIVIAFENNRNTTQYRELIIVDGIGEAQWVQAEPNCFDDPKIAEKLSCFKLTTREA